MNFLPMPWSDLDHKACELFLTSGTKTADMTFALPCARPSQSETPPLRSHRDMGKIKPKGPQNVKQRILAHFAKKTVWPPRAIRDAVAKIDL